MVKSATSAEPKKKATDAFKKGQKITFAIGHRTGTLTGDGTITGAISADGRRMEIQKKDGSGTTWAFPSQIKAAA